MNPLSRDLAALVGGAVSTDAADKFAYARDLWPRRLLELQAGRLPQPTPACVVWPEDAPAVARVLAFAAERSVPVVPYGAGSGVCGGVRPTDTTVVVDLKRLRRIRSLDPSTGRVEVEAGWLGQDFEDSLNARDLTLGHFPSSIGCSTVGGWLAARSAGQASSRYGKIEDMALAMEVALANGEVVRLDRGGSPDWLQLFIGSEGILGAITAATLRVQAAPQTRLFRSYRFDRFARGVEALRRMMQSGSRPAIARLYDPVDTLLAKGGHGSSRHKPGKPPESRLLSIALKRAGLVGRIAGALSTGSLLHLVFEGSAAEAQTEGAAAHAILASLDAEDLGAEPAKDWFARRYEISYRQSPAFASGGFADTMEIAAPWSRLLGVYEAVREALAGKALVLAHLSHAYPDGCSIYFTFTGAGIERYDDVWRRALGAAVGAGACLSHHHGVGRSKAPRLPSDLGALVGVVRALKETFDPTGVLNPGALLPAEDAAPAAPPAAAPAGGIDVDATSLLVHVADGVTVRALVERIRPLHLASAPSDLDLPVGEWLTRGELQVGADPVTHAVTGLTVELPDGRTATLRPSPRRATGPDLTSLFVGAEGRFGRIRAAWLVLTNTPKTAGAGPAPPAADPLAPFSATLEAKLRTGGGGR